MIDATFSQILLEALLALLLIVAAAIDVRTLTISNRLNLVVAGLAPLYWIASGLPLWPEIAIQCALAAGVFILFAAAFYAGMMARPARSRTASSRAELTQCALAVEQGGGHKRSPVAATTRGGLTMSISNDPNVWIIYGLVFLLGVLVGLFMTAGGRKKWKTRYQDESARRDALEREHGDRTREWEKREQDLINRPVVAPVVVGSTVAAASTRRPAGGLMDRVLGRDRDRDGDGIADRDETIAGKVDSDHDGVDDRKQSASRKIDRNDDGIDDRDQ